MRRPTDTPPVPEGLNWDLRLGPAEARPYSPVYLPGTWRAWRAFGSGIVGDLVCHIANILFRALRLERFWERDRHPGADRVVIRMEVWPSERDREGYPTSLKVAMNLPARGDLPPVKATWHAEEEQPEEPMSGNPRGGWGDLPVGTKGSLYSDNPWNANYVQQPEKRFEDFQGGLPETLPRVRDQIWKWLDACQGREKAFSGFVVGGPLTELAQLANLATQAGGTDRLRHPERAHPQPRRS